jgi:AraC family transcriptional regulator of adaptative response/methylated-DNA-[protein]-cysteine methyltransferase
MRADAGARRKFRVEDGRAARHPSTMNSTHADTRDYARIERAIAYLDGHRRAQPSLDDVAQAIGLSPFHAQRLFQRWAGVSPKRFLQFLTATDAVALLRDERPVLATAYDLGLSGPSRLHDLMIAVEAMTPGDVRNAGEGVTIRWGVHDTPFGGGLFGSTARGLAYLAFLHDGADAALEDLHARWPRATILHDAAATRDVAQRVFAPAGTTAPLPLHLRGTNFQLKVWDALLRVPSGRLTTYAELAQAVGAPRAQRAVGAAVGRNPIAFIVPCHRVIRGTGAFGGYHWGEPRKRAILARELLNSA